MISRRFHNDFTSISQWFRFNFTMISHEFHIFPARSAAIFFTHITRNANSKNSSTHNRHRPSTGRAGAECQFKIVPRIIRGTGHPGTRHRSSGHRPSTGRARAECQFKIVPRIIRGTGHPGTAPQEQRAPARAPAAPRNATTLQMPSPTPSHGRQSPHSRAHAASPRLARTHVTHDTNRNRNRFPGWGR